MHRRRVTAEGVEDDQVETVVGRLGERQPAVAEHDARVGRAVAQEREQIGVLGDANNHRVDLVVRPRLLWLRIATKRTRTQPDDGNVPAAVHLMHRLEEVTDRAARRVVGGRDVSQLRVGELDSVDDATVDQLVPLAGRVGDDFVHAEEVPLLKDGELGADGQQAQQQHQTRRQPEAKRASRESCGHHRGNREDHEDANKVPSACRACHHHAVQPAEDPCHRQKPERGEKRDGKKGGHGHVGAERLAVRRRGQRRPEESRADDGDGVLEEVTEEGGGHHGDEKASGRAAHGDPPVELGQV